MKLPSERTPAWRVGSSLQKPESGTEEILPSFIPRIRLVCSKETIRNLSRLSVVLDLMVRTLTGFRGIGLVAISITLRPCVSCLKVPWFDFPHVR